MNEEQEWIVEAFVHGHMSRRQFLTRSLMAGMSASTAAAFLDAPRSFASSPKVVPHRGGTLRVAYSDVPDSFDPGVAALGGSHLAIEHMYSTLTELDSRGNVVPSLAQSWEVSPDDLTYTFHLHRNVSFHNGEPLTAADVKFTLDRLLNPKTGYPFPLYVNTISRSEVLNTHTIKVILKQPLGAFLTFMAFPGNSIVPMRAVLAGADLRNHPIGSGPFQFQGYDEGRLLTLKRYPKFFMPGLPYVDTLEHYLIPDTTARTNALLGGLVDFNTAVAPQDWSRISSNTSFVSRSYESCHWHRIELNNRVAPFNDVRVRQAVNLALDRKAIIDGVFFGLAIPIVGGQIPQWSWAFDSKLHPFSSRPNIQKAKQLLAAAGYPNGLKAQFTLPNLDVLAPQGPIIQANLQAVGINLQLQEVDSTTWLQSVFSAHNFQMSNVYRSSPSIDPDEFTYGFLYTGQPTNASGYANPKMDALLDRARHEVSQTKRKGLYAEIQAMELADLPLIPVLNQSVLIAHAKKVKGFVPLSSGTFKTLRNVWIG